MLGARIGSMLKRLSAPQCESLRIVLQDRVHATRNRERSKKEPGNEWGLSINCPWMPCRELAAGHHGPRKVLALDDRHDHDRNDMHGNHCEERPANNLVEFFSRLTAECTRPNGRCSERK